MNRKAIFLGIIGVLVVLGLLMGMRLVMPRIMHRGMMGNGSAPGQGAGGLIAVSPQGTPLPPLVDSSTLPQNTAKQKVNNLNVSLALSPYPPVGFQETTFDVTLTDENGQAVSDATVNLDLTMPGMWMPLNTFALPYTDGGLYSGRGIFTMRGLWRIEVIIQRGGQKQSVFFDVVL